MNATIASALTLLGIKKKKTLRQKLMGINKRKLLMYSLAGAALVYGAGKFGVPQVVRAVSGR